MVNIIYIFIIIYIFYTTELRAISDLASLGGRYAHPLSTKTYLVIHILTSQNFQQNFQTTCLTSFHMVIKVGGGVTTLPQLIVRLYDDCEFNTHTP